MRLQELLYTARLWWRLAFDRRDIDQELDDEIRYEAEAKTDEKIRGGMTPEEARRDALIELGGVEQVKEQVRAIRAGAWVDAFFRDVRFGLRSLGKSPGFTAAAILTLALGIGATTAVFTLVQQVMLRPLPVAQPDRLWRVGDTVRCCYSDGYAQVDAPANDWSLFSKEAYDFFRAGTPGFEQLAAFQIGEANAHLTVRRAEGSGSVATANGEYVSGNFFETLGIPGWRGRLFTDVDDREGAAAVAVMSFHTWQGKYGSDPSVTGATFHLNGHPFTIMGIAPPDFFGAKVADSDMPDFWLPLRTEPLIAGATSRLKNPRLAWLDLIGRVRPGTHPKALEAQLQVELHEWLASHVPDMTVEEKTVWENQSLHLTPGGAGVSLMRESYKEALWLLLLAAACVLMVACANIASLLLARGVKDRRQIAVRAALGATRGRLVSKALAESLTLSLLGGAAGLALAYAGARLILHLAITGPEAWVPVNPAPSAPIMLFALGVSAITGMVFGIAPAWMASRTDPIEALRGANRTAGLSRGVLGTAGAQKMLVIVQAAASLVLLSAAAMLGQSLRNLERQNFGFDTSGRYLVEIDPRTSGYRQEQLVTLFREIEGQLRAIPGVRAAGSVLEAPLSGWVWPHDISVEGRPQDHGSCGWTRVTPGFFDALGNGMLTGRPITGDDKAGTRPVAVVNESFVRRFYGNEDPVGRHFHVVTQTNQMYEIIGVAADVDFGGGPEPMYFLPESQGTQFGDPESQEREVSSHYLYNVVIWAPGNPPGLEAEARRALQNVDPNLLEAGVRPYSEVIHSDFARQNMIASLTWLFGAVALVLAAVGLYSVTAYGVEQRTSEIGVRMALGARRGSTVVMVLGGAFTQVAAGLALGIPAAIGGGHLIASQLFGVRPWDPLILAGSALLLGLAALIAAIIPAHRAASVDPMQALRRE